MSSEPSVTSDYIKIPTAVMVPESPVITITPATLTTSFPNGLPTLPITPTNTAPRPILKTKKSTTPISTYILSPTSLLTPDPMTPHASLQAPLKRHLSLLHPSTPSEILQFCALRLLSKENPLGYDGDWTPIYEPDHRGVKVDLSAAGLRFDAPKWYAPAQSDEGEGKGTDKRLEGMYKVARESYGLLATQEAGN